MTKQNIYFGTLTAIGLILATGAASAQTVSDGTAPAETTAETTNEGAFDALSPGGQKISRALFEAQEAPAGDGTTTGDGTTAGDGTAAATEASTASEPLTLDDIAAAKANGRGWGEIFKEMKAQGLIAEKNLGQVVSSANHRNRLGDAGGDGTADGNGGATDGTATGDAAMATATSTASTATSAAKIDASASGRPDRVTMTLGNGQTISVRGAGHRSSRHVTAAGGAVATPKPGRGHGQTAGPGGDGGGRYAASGNAGGSHGGRSFSANAGAGTVHGGGPGAGHGRANGHAKGSRR